LLVRIIRELLALITLSLLAVVVEVEVRVAVVALEVCAPQLQQQVAAVL
jgi:hypothetical protein